MFDRRLNGSRFVATARSTAARWTRRKQGRTLSDLVREALSRTYGIGAGR
jgi:hypothetical protein